MGSAENQPSEEQISIAKEQMKEVKRKAIEDLINEFGYAKDSEITEIIAPLFGPPEPSAVIHGHKISFKFNDSGRIPVEDGYDENEDEDAHYVISIDDKKFYAGREVEPLINHLRNLYAERNKTS